MSDWKELPQAIAVNKVQYALRLQLVKVPFEYRLSSGYSFRVPERWWMSRCCYALEIPKQPFGFTGSIKHGTHIKTLKHIRAMLLNKNRATEEFIQRACNEADKHLFKQAIEWGLVTDYQRCKHG